MTRARVWPCLAVAITTALALRASALAAALLPAGFVDEGVVGGLQTPVGLAFLPDGRLLFCEQLSGRVRLIVNGTLAPTDPVLTVPGVRNDNFFRGLQGLAIDPRWPTHPYLYCDHATTTGRVVVVRFTVTGDLSFNGSGALQIDPASRREIFTDLFDAAHNGGTLRFGPDQMLYVSVGDSLYSPCSAQNLATLRGVILRLDVRGVPPGPGPAPPKSSLVAAGNPFATDPNVNARLVWARGFRHPFRFHVDPLTGELFVADVGENRWEELDQVSGPGANYGWPLYEGAEPWIACDGVPSTGFVAPIHAYADGQSAISAGLYRRSVGAASCFPASYEGNYFFADYYHGALRRLERSGGVWAIAAPVAGQPGPEDWGRGYEQVSDFLQAPDGSLWYCKQATDYVAGTGEIRRIRTSATASVAPTADASVVFETPSPTPSHGAVRLAFVLAQAANVSLDLYDAQGRLVAHLLEAAHLGAGRHEVQLPPSGPSRSARLRGAYFARLTVGDARFERRLVIVN